MPIPFDYAKCTVGLDEAPEMVLDTDFREPGNNDFRDFSDSKLDEDIQRFTNLIQSTTLKTKDNNLRLELRLQALTGERTRRENIKANPVKQVFKQSSEKRGFMWDLDSADRSSKERRVEPSAPPPAFQSELQIHRFRRDNMSLKKTGEPTKMSPMISVLKTPLISVPREVKTTTSSVKKSAGKASSNPFNDSPDPVVLFSSDDESLGEELKQRASISKRRISARIAEKRRVESHQKIAYPSRDDPDAVEVYYRDLKHLAPAEFLNDTVIDFYIKYIQRPEALEPDRRERFHFFNSFFYKKLVEAFEAEKQAEAFSKLRKWTKGIKIFDKSYLFLPINDRYHWSLALVAFSVSDVSKDVVIPHIFHLDSLDNIHSSSEVFKFLRGYLELEHEQMQSATKVSWSNIVAKRVEVPRQENEYDCGLFLLYYIQCFVETAPLPCKLSEETTMFGKRWFRPSTASSLRHKIKEILEQLFQEQTLE